MDVGAKRTYANAANDFLSISNDPKIRRTCRLVLLRFGIQSKLIVTHDVLHIGTGETPIDVVETHQVQAPSDIAGGDEKRRDNVKY